MPPIDTATLTERLRALADDAVAGTGLYVVDVEVRGREGSRVVEVYVDGDAGAPLDAIAEASSRLSFLLDTEDPVKGHYTLNVSSPGADRPLALPRQYPQHVGRTLAVTLAGAEGAAPETLTGSLRRADATADGGIVLAVPGQPTPAEIPYAAIREARVALPW